MSMTSSLLRRHRSSWTRGLPKTWCCRPVDILAADLPELTLFIYRANFRRLGVMLANRTARIIVAPLSAMSMSDGAATGVFARFLPHQGYEYAGARAPMLDGGDPPFAYAAYTSSLVTEPADLGATSPPTPTTHVPARMGLARSTSSGSAVSSRRSTLLPRSGSSGSSSTIARPSYTPILPFLAEPVMEDFVLPGTFRAADYPTPQQLSRLRWHGLYLENVPRSNPVLGANDCFYDVLIVSGG